MTGAHMEQAVREFKAQRDSSRSKGATSHGATRLGQGGSRGDEEQQQEAMQRQLRAWASLLQGLGGGREVAMGNGSSGIEENE